MLGNLSNAVRGLSVDMVVNANSGHLGLPLGMADCVTALFKNHMKFSAKNPNWPNRDRFVLSGGHGSALLYSILHLCGYEKFTIESLKNFRKFGSAASGHPEYDISAGIEMTTGPLGQGIATAVGMAIAERILNNRLGDNVINHFTYVCVLAYLCRRCRYLRCSCSEKAWHRQDVGVHSRYEHSACCNRSLCLHTSYVRRFCHWLYDWYRAFSIRHKTCDVGVREQGVII